MERGFYIDVFFLVNFCMDFGLLLMLRRILKADRPVRRLAAAGLLGAASACAVAVFSLWSVGFVLSPVLMVWAGFRPAGPRELVKDTLALAAEAVCVGGTMEAILQHTRAGYWLTALLEGNSAEGMPALIWLFASAGAFFLFRYLWLTMTEIRREKLHLRTVRLCLGERQVRTVGFLDTGNRLTEPVSGRPVHIVSEGLWLRMGCGEQEVSRIPYRTVGNPWGLMEVAEIDSLEIGESSGPEKPALIGRAPFPISGDGSYEILLHETIL